MRRIGRTKFLVRPGYLNDAIVFFWDFRPADEQGAPRSERIGLCGMVVPEVGTGPKPEWDLGGGPVPQNLTRCTLR